MTSMGPDSKGILLKPLPKQIGVVVLNLVIVVAHAESQNYNTVPNRNSRSLNPTVPFY